MNLIPANDNRTYSLSSSMKISDEVEALLVNIAQILDVVKTEWGDEWSKFDQEQRDHITNLLRQRAASQSTLPQAPTDSSKRKQETHEEEVARVQEEIAHKFVHGALAARVEPTKEEK